MLTHCIDGQIETPARVCPGLADRCAVVLRSKRWGRGNNRMLIYITFFFCGERGGGIGHKRRKFINFRRLAFVTRNQPLYLDFKLVFCVLLSICFCIDAKEV
jgi:hypothetical protein